MIQKQADLLNAKSLRECDFYTDYLLKNIRSASSRNLRGDSLADCLAKLNEELTNLINKNRAPKNFATQMRSAFNATQLPLSHFRWIDKKNERLCNWAWAYLKTKATKTIAEQSVIQSEELFTLSEDAFSIEKDNPADRSIDIVNAFYDGEADAQQQEKMLGSLKTKWQEVHLDNSITNWLEDNNPNHWSWAWNYLQHITQRPLKLAWSPINDMEKKAAIIATIDLSDNVDRKALIVDKMKKAWSQKKFREKTNGRKPYSISMTLNTKQKLNALAEESGMKINEMVEHLIQNEYTKRNDHE